MRATLVIPDPIYASAEREAQAAGCDVSQWVTEAVVGRLGRAREAARPRARFRIEPEDMGPPLVDLADRDALERAMGG
jgi:hypothetical protein